jgi:hypothetical protein
MKNNNKKIGLYVGVAFLFGAIGFIVYSKMSSNKLPISNTSNDETNNITPSKWSLKNPFSSNPSNQLTASQLSIKTPAFATDLLNSFK